MDTSIWERPLRTCLKCGKEEVWEFIELGIIVTTMSKAGLCRECREKQQEDELIERLR